MQKLLTGKQGLRRLLSLMLAIVLVLSVTALPVLAANSVTKQVANKGGSLANMTKVKATSGKGLFYSWGWKKTTVTIQNTGRYPVNVYEVTQAGSLIYLGQLHRGQSWHRTLSGSGRTTTFYFQRVTSTTSVRVGVNAGSVS